MKPHATMHNLHAHNSHMQAAEDGDENDKNEHSEVTQLLKPRAQQGPVPEDQVESENIVDEADGFDSGEEDPFLEQMHDVEDV